jgi:hypothetical protein
MGSSELLAAMLKNIPVSCRKKSCKTGNELPTFRRNSVSLFSSQHEKGRRKCDTTIGVYIPIFAVVK